MKKMMSIILSLMLLLGCVSAVAEAAETEAPAKVPLGTVSINGAFTLQCGIPEGYTPRPLIATSDLIIASLTAEDPEKPVMYLSVAFDETYADVERMNDLDADALDLLEKTYLENDPSIEISYGATGLGTTLLIARQSEKVPHYIDFLSIYKGYFVEFILMNSEAAQDRTLTEEELMMAVDFLTELDFIEADEAAVRAQAEANSVIGIARITACDAEKKTVTAVIKTPLIMEKDQVEAALEEKHIYLGEDGDVEITAVKEEENTIEINNEYYLTLQDDGTYIVRSIYDDAAVLITMYDEMEFELAPDVVFLDYIDPESLESLEEPTTHTIEEFAAMVKSEGTDSVGPGFAVDNVNVTIDENRKITSIERVYVPWQ